LQRFAAGFAFRLFLKIMKFEIKPEVAGWIRWNSRGSCGNAGCPDPDCGCALCGEPIGVAENDPRWDNHDEFCGGCELCEDQAPIILFRGEGKAMQQASFHWSCFNKVTRFKSSAADA
jgi:hypothetical protein